MAPLYLEGGSFVGPRIHIAQKLQWRQRKKKPKTKEVKFIEKRKRSVTFTMDQINRAF